MGEGDEGGTIKQYGVVLSLGKFEVTANGQTHHVTPKECKLLATLMQHPGQVLTREFLMWKVWETDFTEDTRTIEVHIHWLRGKIEEDPRDPQLIRTVRNVGYWFAEE